MRKKINYIYTNKTDLMSQSSYTKSNVNRCVIIVISVPGTVTSEKIRDTCTNRNLTIDRWCVVKWISFTGSCQNGLLPLGKFEIMGARCTRTIPALTLGKKITNSSHY